MTPATVMFLTKHPALFAYPDVCENFRLPPDYLIIFN